MTNYCFLNFELDQNSKLNMKSAKITGFITDLKFPSFANNRTLTFSVHFPNSGKTLSAKYEGSVFLPIRKGDKIHSECKVDDKQILHITELPCVVIPNDYETIKDLIIRKCLMCSSEVSDILTNIEYRKEEETNISHFINNLAEKWNKTKDISILDKLPIKKCSDFLEWWYKERNVRCLQLLGISEEEIRESGLACQTVYEFSIANPYKLYAIPIEKCDKIVQMFCLAVKPEWRRAGLFSHRLYSNLKEKGHVYTPKKYLTSEFPDLEKNFKLLTEEYDVVIENDNCYLRRPYEVEKFLTYFFNNLKNFKTSPRKLINSMDLSDDQTDALTGALNNNISIITGAAGTGKCLSPETEVLLYNGISRQAQNIKRGDLLMGPDSFPRYVLGTNSGEELMFKIITEYGYEFECNKSHILTLRGLTPYIDGNKIVYSVKGIRQFSIIKNEECLKEDIFDISLSLYIKWPQQMKNDCTLIQKRIELEDDKVDLNPYVLGKFLGSFLITSDISCLLDFEINKICPSIPNKYKFASIKNRLSFLAALLDFAEPCGIESVKLRCNHPLLINDIKYIAESLGYPVIVSNNNFLIIKKWNLERCEIHQFSTHRFTIKELKINRYCGFTLSYDGRFLLGNFLITHNTTCIQQLVFNLRINKVEYALCSFTGKAVARIKEVTQEKSAATMNRLIVRKFSNIEHLIVDETSMVTSGLLYDLLKVYPEISKITFLGDDNQLPPIGWGSLFSEMIKSGKIPTFRLITNYRNLTENGVVNGIIHNSTKLLNSKDDFDFENFYNFKTINGDESKVFEIVQELKESGVSLDKISIITPYKRCLSVLNSTCQKIFNSENESIIDKHLKWCVGDRVILKENDAETGVYNGEMGTILSFTEKYLTIDFKLGGILDFTFESKRNKVIETVANLDLGFALTIDKSQGSEFEYVVFFIDDFSGSSFLNKNRIYTAITRAKSKIWIVTPSTQKLEIAAIKPLPFRYESLGDNLRK